METKNIRLPNQLHRKLLALLVIFLLVLNLKGLAQAPPPIPGGGQYFTIKVYLEGLYNTATSKMNKAQDYIEPAIVDRFNETVVDKVTVELHDQLNYATVPVYPNIQENINLHEDGKIYINLPASGIYWLTIKTRNHIETVSAAPINLTITSTYDFTTAASQAYGDNQKMLASGVYGIYAGDVNGDGIVDVTDMSSTENQSASFSLGYLVDDINGDGLVDIADMSSAENNSTSFIFAITP